MTLNLQEIRRKYPSIYDVDVLFTNGESMNIGKDIVIVDYKDLNDMIPDLAGITLDGVPTYLQPYNVIISIFPSKEIVQFRKDLLIAFPHFSQATPWIPHIFVEAVATEELKDDLLSSLKKITTRYTVDKIVLKKHD